MAPVQTVQVQGTPIVSMSGPTQIIASSSCTPLAIAATSQGQQLAQLAQQGMSTISTTTQAMNASQILGTSQITLTPTLASGCVFFEDDCKNLRLMNDLFSAIHGTNDKYLTSIGHVECNAADHLVSGNDSQHFATLAKSVRSRFPIDGLELMAGHGKRIWRRHDRPFDGLERSCFIFFLPRFKRKLFFQTFPVCDWTISEPFQVVESHPS